MGSWTAMSALAQGEQIHTDRTGFVADKTMLRGGLILQDLIS
jgi:hypothetical protein